MSSPAQRCRVLAGWSERRDRRIEIGVDTAYRHGFWLVPDLMRDYCDVWTGKG